jgi:hypothetical protein
MAKQPPLLALASRYGAHGSTRVFSALRTQLKDNPLLLAHDVSNVLQVILAFSMLLHSVHRIGTNLPRNEL